MIILDNLGANIEVQFSGNDITECKRFFGYVISHNAIKKPNYPIWILPISYKEDIEKQFNTQELIHDWDYIGANMKLTPYPYQKEDISYA